MIGKSFLDRQDRENAYVNFNQAEQQHIRLVSAGGGPGNSYLCGGSSVCPGDDETGGFRCDQVRPSGR